MNEAKGLNKILFFFFGLFLLVYFYRTANFWMSYTTYDVSVRDILRHVAMASMIAIIVVLLIVNGKLYFRGIHAVCFLWLTTMVFVLLLSESPILNYLYCFCWPMIFEATYIFIKDRTNRIDKMIRLYYVIAGIGLLFFLQAILFKEFGGQSNMIYFFVLTVPILLIKENKTWRGVVLVLTTFLALLSMKRSMMLAIALFWVIIGMAYMLKSGRNKIMVLFAGLVIVFVSYYSFNYIDKLSGGFMTARFEMEDMSNGREDLYENTWLMQKNSSTIEWLFGHGHNAVRKDSLNLSAHNEWLEILYDYGAIILMVYLCLWIGLIKRWFFHYRTNSKYLIAYTLSLCVFAVMSMVSQLVLYYSYFLYLVMFWAIVEALCDTEYYEYRRLSWVR